MCVSTTRPAGRRGAPRAPGALFALCLGLLAGACQMDVGTVNLHLVSPVREGQLPLDPSIVQRIRVRVEGPDHDEVAEFTPGAGGGHTALDALPLGRDCVVTVEGLNSRGGVWSRGVSAPFEVTSGTTDLFLYISVRDQFAAPPTVSDPRFDERFTVSLRVPRAFHATTGLPGGHALVSGGLSAAPADPLDLVDDGAAAVQVAERFDASSGAFLREGEGPGCEAGAPLCQRNPRAFHSAVLLGDGEAVLVAGGEPLLGAAAEHDAEFFDVAELTFEAAPSMERRRTRAGAGLIRVAPGGMLLAGGLDVAGGVLDSVELFDDQGSGTFRALNIALAEPRAGVVVVPYRDRGVLAIGGWQDWQPERRPSDQVERLRSKDGAFDRYDFRLGEPRAEHAAARLADGRVLVCGGLTTDLAVSGTCEVLDPATAEARPAEVGLLHPRWGHTATALPDGRVLVAGGFGSADGQRVLNTGELLDPTGVAKTVARPMVSARAGHTATLLDSGLVVLVGGVGVGGELASTDYELFNP